MELELKHLKLNPVTVTVTPVVPVVESNLYSKLKKLDVQRGNKDKLSADHVTQVCKAHDWVILHFLQHSRTCEANHRGIKGERWAQRARVRRCKEEHTFTERQSWGHRTEMDLGMVN